MKGYEKIESYNLMVNNTGDVLRIDGTKINQFKANGYFNVKVKVGEKFKTLRVHRLVAMVFVPNPENKKCVDHKDGNKLNNNSNNLRWCTIGENLQFENVNRTPKIYKVKRISENGEEKIFKDVLEACLYPWQKYKILECCNGKRKSYDGFKWELIN